MNALFLDTVGMIALWDEGDQWHDDALRAFNELKLNRREVLTTTYVLLECGNTAARRPYRSAVTQWREILTLNNGLIDPSSDDRSRAWLSYDRGEFGNAGIVDQVSFVVMRRLGISHAFTNDWHFKAAGFETLF